MRNDGWNSETNLGDSAILAITFGAIIVCVCRHTIGARRTNVERNKRRMSPTSYNLAYGSLPSKSNICEPIINGVLFFEECPEPKAVMGVVEALWKDHERLRGTPTRCSGGAWYCNERDETIDPAGLVRVVNIRGNDGDLVNALEDHSDGSLTKHRDGLPWWEFLLIQNDGVGRSACVFRAHHALADGLSIVTALERVFTNAADGRPIPEIVPKSMTDKFLVLRSKSFFGRLCASLRAMTVCLSLPLSDADDDILFRKLFAHNLAYNGKRRCIVFPPVPLAYVNEIKTKAGVSLNDVIFACHSQAIHDYCADRRCPILFEKGKSTRCRALVPSSVPTGTMELRNTWACVSCDMGVGIDGVGEKLRHIHGRMKSLQNVPPVQLALQTMFISLLSESFLQKATYDLCASHSLVVTNVPGPADLCSFAGKTVASMQCLFPNLLPQICMTSYAGNVVGNIMLDPESIPDGETLAEYYGRAFVTLGTECNVKVPTNLLDRYGSTNGRIDTSFQHE